MADEKPPPAHKTRAAKSMGAIEGDDEFSVSSIKPGVKRPQVVLKPRLDEAPLPKDLQPPSRERNLFIRLFAKIFR